MSFSVNTNNGAFIALQNLSTTNKSISEVQNRINTGLKVSSAKDDSATYAIAQNLRGDISGLSAVRTSLDRAKSSLDVGIQAGEAMSDLLNRAREIAVAATDRGLDSNSLTAMNNDFKALMNQIGSVVGQAEFNGTNLIKASPDSISAITSVKQNSTVDRISVSGANLNTNSTAATLASSAATATVAAAGTATALVTSTNDGDRAFGRATFEATNGVTVNSDGSFTVDTSVINASGAGAIAFSAGGVAWTTAGGAAANNQNSGSVTFQASALSSTAGGTFTYASSGTKNAGALDLTNAGDRRLAVAVVDKFKSNVNSTLASFGSASRQIDIQQQFARKISDSIESGIGNLVDADLARESARLQSLQVKQQLGLQALSIANQSPQSIVSLFR
jgi:flagellin